MKMDRDEEKDGGSAFPGGVLMIPIKDTADQQEVTRTARMIAEAMPAGASMLDLFAMAALQGMVSSRGEWTNADCAKDAYDYAEAMLIERERRQG